MAEGSKLVRHPLNDWQVEALRLTAFTRQPQLEGADWWEQLVGASPDQRSSRPRKGEWQDIGVYERGKLILTVQPLRIDWKYTVEPIPEEERAVLGAFTESVTNFAEIMQRWLQLSPPLKRLAFGCVILMPMPDLKSAYETLSAYLHNIKLDPDGSSDFLYQINRKRDSRTNIKGLTINRLSKWSVSSLSAVQISLGAEPQVVATGSKNFACRVELDINTVPEFSSELQREQWVDIFQELVELTKEIAEAGDIP
jgi:hypothetical protein